MNASPDDTRHMARALQLARLGLYGTSPNPRVGCVLVREGSTVGEGYHARAGEAHAEVLALREAGQQARGATAFVTLEPCSHHGRTPPCADALVAAGVSRVVVAIEDPDPRVSGSGIARLRAAGIAVESGLLATEARELNAGFFHRLERGRPLLRCKLAMSLDGRTAMASGESRWITGEAARLDVQRLRARSCAVLTGVGTVQQDDPRLDVREGVPEPIRQPLRVICDSRLSTSLAARVLAPPGTVLIACAHPDPEARAALASAGVECLPLAGTDGRVDVAAVLAELGRRQCNEVLLEAGATLCGAFASAGLIDEYVVYVAPVLLGSRARPLLELPFERMEQKLGLRINDITAIGQDWRISARPA